MPNPSDLESAVEYLRGRGYTIDLALCDMMFAVTLPSGRPVEGWVTGAWIENRAREKGWLPQRSEEG